MKSILLILYSLTINSTVNAANILSHPPKEPKINEHFVFYSHGLIVEGSNQTPKHDRFGMYDFPSVKHALADQKYNLIAYHRPLKQILLNTPIH